MQRKFHLVSNACYRDLWMGYTNAVLYWPFITSNKKKSKLIWYGILFNTTDFVFILLLNVFLYKTIVSLDSTNTYDYLLLFLFINLETNHTIKNVLTSCSPKEDFIHYIQPYTTSPHLYIISIFVSKFFFFFFLFIFFFSFAYTIILFDISFFLYYLKYTFSTVFVFNVCILYINCII